MEFKVFLQFLISDAKAEQDNLDGGDQKDEYWRRPLYDLLPIGQAFEVFHQSSLMFSVTPGKEGNQKIHNEQTNKNTENQYTIDALG